MHTEEKILTLLQEQLHIHHLEIQNDSHKHQGHAGWKETADTHFAITVVADEFETLTRIKRHQLIYSILADLMKDTIHALQIAAYSKKEWENKEKKEI